MSEKKCTENEETKQTPEKECCESETHEKGKGKCDGKKRKELEAKIEELEVQLADMKDSYLRTLAEYDNFKKRETANRDKTAGFVKAETIKILLPAIDNINRALTADENSPDYAKGVTMTVKSLTDALTKLGLEEINPINEPFDVNYHQAVMRVEDDSVGENIVTEVLQTGYKLGDTVLRFAMVKVANCG